jgi:hypothetical protein
MGFDRARIAGVSLAAIAMATFGGCNVVTIDDYPCPPGGTKLTYENFGQPFMAEYCNVCHSAPDGQRNGAPDDFVFTTHADVIAHKDRIFARAADTNDSMPVGPDRIPAGLRVDLANWLACGAP